ncbi:protein kinase [Chloroflexota bacterium]
MTEDADVRVIGERYRLKEQLGVGGMGTVYRAIDLQTQAVVAVKVLHPELLADDPLLLERFTREGDALRRLNHPNIVNMLDNITEDGKHYLVMEYVAGGSLRDLLIDQATLPVKRVLEIALDLADALTRAHRLDIIHRDLKPANILLADDGTPRLTDFGIARIGASTITRTGAVLGTLAYMAPEAFGGGEFDRRGDIWAFGVILHEMLCGERPFSSGQTAELIAMILGDPLPDIMQFRPDTPIALVTLINQMLEKDKAQRISSVRQVGSALENIMDQLVVSDSEDPEETSHHADIFAQISERSRFSTPTPLDSQAISSDPDEITFTPTPHQAMMTGVGFASPVTTGAGGSVVEPVADPTQVGRRVSPRARGGIAVSTTLLIVALIVGGWLVFGRPPSPAPVEPDEYMVLVADMEALGTQERDVTRFIVEDLRHKLEVSVPFSTIQVRSYEGVVTSSEQARQVAEANGATVIVWGDYDDDFIQLNVEVGVLSAFPYIAMDRAMVDSSNVRIRMADERTQTIAPDVLSALVILQNADGAGFEAIRTLAILDQIIAVDDHTVEVLGNSVGAHGHRYFTSLTTDPAYALQEINAAIALDPGNPLLYTSRHAPLYRLGELDGMHDDAMTAIRLGPESWALPYYILGNYAYFTNELADALDYYDQIIEMRPDDWFPYTFRGALHYLLGHYEEARTDLEHSVSLGPNTNFPYPMLAMLALREGKVDEAQAQIATVLRDFPDPTFGTRVVEALFGPDTEIILAPIFSAFGNMVLERHSDVIDDVAAALAIDDQLSDLYLMQGFAYCNEQDYEAAEAAYTQGIAIDPDFIVLYVLRAEVRLRQQKMFDALADVMFVQQSDLADAFADLIDGARTGDITCENFFSAETDG